MGYPRRPTKIEDFFLTYSQIVGSENVPERLSEVVLEFLYIAFAVFSRESGPKDANNHYILQKLKGFTP